jgi:hypothetical protein
MDLPAPGSRVDRDVSDGRFSRQTTDGVDHSPWPLPGRHVYLPYSIESHCMQLPVTAYENREDKVLIFAKRSSESPYDTQSLFSSLH